MLICLDVALITVEMLGFCISYKLPMCHVFKGETTVSLSGTPQGSVTVLAFSVVCWIWIWPPHSWVASSRGICYQGSEIQRAMLLVSECQSGTFRVLPDWGSAQSVTDYKLSGGCCCYKGLPMNESSLDKVVWETRICPCRMQELSKQICLCETNFLLVSCKNLHPVTKQIVTSGFFFFNCIRLFGELSIVLCWVRGKS